MTVLVLLRGAHFLTQYLIILHGLAARATPPPTHFAQAGGRSKIFGGKGSAEYPKKVMVSTEEAG